jgi:hypothetical protein
MTGRKTRRGCFISATYGVDLTELQHVLDDLGVVWEWALSDSSDKPILPSVVSAIKRTDFVIGVLQDGQLTGNVLFELGIAVGLGKPRLLLRIGPAELPNQLGTSAVFDSDLTDPKLLAFQVDLFLRSLDSRLPLKRKHQSMSQTKKPVQDMAAPDLLGSALEQSVAAAITRRGGRVTIPSRVGHERTPDLLMWMPHLDSELFNPAAIEVVGTPKVPDLSRLQLQFASFLESSGLRCGLIVVKSALGEKELQRLTPIPWIFTITLSDFEDKLDSGDLGRWARHERNRLAHGVR